MVSTPTVRRLQFVEGAKIAWIFGDSKDFD
jgi:hypothetical protein